MTHGDLTGTGSRMLEFVGMRVLPELVIISVLPLLTLIPIPLNSKQIPTTRGGHPIQVIKGNRHTPVLQTGGGGGHMQL